LAGGVRSKPHSALCPEMFCMKFWVKIKSICVPMDQNKSTEYSTGMGQRNFSLNIL